MSFHKLKATFPSIWLLELVMVPQSCKHSILEPDMNFCELMFNLDYTVKNFLKHKTKQRNSKPEKHKQTSLPKN